MDEQTAQEETEDKLKQCIDNLMDKRYLFFHPVPVKEDVRVTVLESDDVLITSRLSLCVSVSAKTRLAGLESLRLAFSSKLLYEFLTERRLTVSDCLERSLKKGTMKQMAAVC